MLDTVLIGPAMSQSQRLLYDPRKLAYADAATGDGRRADGEAPV